MTLLAFGDIELVGRSIIQALLQANTSSTLLLRLIIKRIPQPTTPTPTSLKRTLSHLLLLSSNLIKLLLRLRVSTTLAVELVTELLEGFFLVHVAAVFVNILELDVGRVLLVKELSETATLDHVGAGVIFAGPFFALAGSHVVPAGGTSFAFTGDLALALGVGFGLDLVGK